MKSQRRGRISSSRHSAARSKSRGVVGRFVEQLEDRRLLTALFGGDVFRYQQADGQNVQIALNGNAMIEVAGSVIDDQNHLILTDLPGEYAGTGPHASGQTLGGVAGRYGVQVLRQTNWDWATPPAGFTGGADINFQALASSATGNTYGFNFAEITPPGGTGGGGTAGGDRYVHLVQFTRDPATGLDVSDLIATPTQATLRDDVAAQLNGMNGTVGDVAVDPTTGLVYILMENGNLYTVDRNGPTPATPTLVGVVRNTSTNTPLNAVTLSAMAFTPAGQLYIITSNSDNNPAADGSGLPTGPVDPNATPPAAPTTNLDVAILRINKANATFTNADITPIQVYDTQNNAWYETQTVYYSMIFESPTSILAVGLPPQAAGGGGGAQNSGYELDRINLANGQTTVIGQINFGGQQGGAGGGGAAGVIPHRVDGLAWATDSNGNPMLVGLDNGIYDQNAAAHSALIQIPVGAPDQSIPLCPNDSIVPAHGLASFTETGDTKELLWTVYGNQLIRGSAVTLPVDENGVTEARSVRAADFNPIDGLLYFVVELEVPNGNPGTQFTLYTLDVNAGVGTPNPSAIQNSLTRQTVFLFTPPGTNTPESPAIESIAFDQTGPASVRLVGLAASSVGNRLVTVNMANLNQKRYSPPILMDGQQVDNITGLAFFGDDPSVHLGEDPTQAENFVYAVQNTGPNTSQMLRIRFVNNMVDTVTVSPEGAPPTAMVWGLLTPIHNANNPQAGDSIEGLTWNPVMINPFTFQRGTLLGTDTGTDQLVAIDFRLRSPTVSLFNIHFAQGDINSTVAISGYIRPVPGNPPDPANDWRVTPFEGDIGQLRVGSYQNPIDSPANSGTVLLGFKSNDVDCVASADDLVPYLAEGNPNILSGLIAHPFGMTNVGSGYLPVGVFAPMTGILQNITNPTAFMIGANLDSVQAASARADGTIALIDSDLCDENGNAFFDAATGLPLDQLALIWAGQTAAGTTAPVVDSNGNPLYGVIALDWADPDGDGVQSLFAIYNIAGVPTLGTIDADPASPTYGTFTATSLDLTGGGAIGGIQAMAFSPVTQHLFVVDDTGSLFDFVLDPADPTTGSLYAGPLITGLPTIKSMDFSTTGLLIAQDIQNARLIDINPDYYTFGTVAATPIGSFRASVGVITFDPIRGVFLAVDNALSRETMERFQSAFANEGGLAESAMLIPIVGLTVAQATPQDIGKFLLAGTVMGVVQASGSIGQFYAGWLLTGNASGGTAAVPSNFFAGGEIRELDVQTYIGTNDATQLINGAPESYNTLFELNAGGRVGQVKVGQDLAGWAYATNNALKNLPIDTYQHDIEPGAGFGKTLNLDQRYLTTGDNFMAGYLSDTVYFNDTFATAQYVGTIDTSLPGQSAVRILGELAPAPLQGVADTADFYGVALLAGQSVVVQLVPIQGLTAHVGVFDPDGRLIASDYSDIDPNQYQYQKFTFTADRPGVYRFAVGSIGTGTFDGGGGGTYELDIAASTDGVAAGPGNIGLGGVVAGRHIFDGRALGTQFQVGAGDLGGISAGSIFASESVPTVLTEDDYLAANPPIREAAEVGATIDVLAGNMRSIEATSVGFWNTNPPGPTLGVDIHAINGTVGLVRSTGTGDNDTLYLNDDVSIYGAPRVSDHDPAGVARQVAAGGDYQVVSSNTQFTGTILTNTRIGVVRAATIPFGASSTFFVANADQQGDDGVIDLIYSQGDIGSQASGGPAIITGPGGNLRYMYAGGIVWRDPYFGGGTPEATLFQPGESASFTDDSGAFVTISTAAPPPATGATPPSLTITTYGVRGSGGVAIASISANGATTNSINVVSSTLSATSGVEIGRIQLNGTGQAPTTNAAGLVVMPTLAAGEIPLYLQLGGSANVDVFDVTGGNIYSIVNSTGGEVVNVNATTIGRLESGYVGVAKHYTDAMVNGLAVRANNFPFSQQRISINSGDIAMVIAKHAIGNINSSGSVGQVIADSDRFSDWWEYDGIVAPIYANGEIQDVSIGQGITSSGTGGFAHSGLFANGAIRTVRGSGDIRGNIVSNTSIGRIQITGGGAIINSNIMVITDLAASTESPVVPRDLTQDNSPISNPNYLIGAISIQGTRPSRWGVALNGGIIGSNIAAAHIGAVNVQLGFGIIDSDFSVIGTGVMKGFTTDGYGIRDCNFYGGAIIGSLIAAGNGGNIPVSNYSYQLRQSEFPWMEFDYRRGRNDWSSHFEPNRTTDLDKYMGTTAASPSMPFDAITSSGVIAGTKAWASRTMNQLKAWSVRPSDRTSTGIVPNDAPSYRTSDFHIANKITYFDVAGDAVDMQLTTGGMKRLSIGGNMIGPSVTVSGILSELKIQGHYIPAALRTDYDQDYIRAIGGNGEITQMYVGGGINLPVMAQRKIGKWTVLGNYSPFGKFGPRGKIMVNGKQVAP